VNLKAEQSYQVVVDGYAGRSGSYTLTVVSVNTPIQSGQEQRQQSPPMSSGSLQLSALVVRREPAASARTAPPGRWSDRTMEDTQARDRIE